MTQQPQAKYRHDYRAPEYLISDIDLTFDLDAAKTVVTAESKVSRHAAASDVPLRLDGEDLTLVSLLVNGQPWSDYKEENNQLAIGGLPEHFTLTIVNEISPAVIPRWKGCISPAKRCVPNAKRKVFAILPGTLTVRTCWRASPPKLSPTKPNTRSCFPTVTA